MAGKIPEKFIEELLNRVDIVDVIDARVPLRKAGKDYKACCPFHEEKTPSFTVSQDKQFYHCFGCGAHGSAIGFLMQYEHMAFREAVEDLAQRAGLTVPQAAQTTKTPPDNLAVLAQVLLDAERYYRRQLREHPQAPAAAEYLKGRGLSGEVAADFGLGFAPDGWDNLLRAVGTDAGRQQALLDAGLLIRKDSGGYYDRFRNRVMFPIHDYRGRIIGFGGRVLGQGEPKYLNSPETPLFHKGRELYGLYRARDAIKRENRVLVVEGYMDVVALAQFGVDFAVATLGTATTRDHLERLFRFAPEVIFCFDGDRAGREAAWRALENALPVLGQSRQIGFLFLPEGEDPDSLVRGEGQAAFVARLAGATPFPDYFFQVLAERADLDRPGGAARLAELARPLLSNLPPGALRHQMLDRLQDKSRLAAESLAELLADAPGRSSRQRFGPRRTVRGAAPSLVRTAIAVLLQHPQLASHVADPESLRALDRPGVTLLVELLALLGRQPGLNTGSIIEHFRDSEHQHNLARLATWQHPAVEHASDAEFLDLVRQLRRDINRQQTEQLYSKERLVGLTAAEKSELRRLLAERQQFESVSPAS